MAAKAGGSSPSSRTGTPASGPLSHSPRSRPNTLTSWWRPPWRCQSRSTPSWRKPTPRSARVERTFSGFEYEPTRCMPSSANARWRHDRLRLAVRARPPEVAAEPRADDAAAVADRELGEPGDAGRAVLPVDDEQVEALAARALVLEALDVLQRLLHAGVRAPREPARDLGVARQREQGGRVLGARRAQGQRGTMQGRARAAVRHPRQPTGARGGPRRRG